MLEPTNLDNQNRNYEEEARRLKLETLGDQLIDEEENSELSAENDETERIFSGISTKNGLSSIPKVFEAATNSQMSNTGKALSAASVVASTFIPYGIALTFAAAGKFFSYASKGLNWLAEKCFERDSPILKVVGGAFLVTAKLMKGFKIFCNKVSNIASSIGNKFGKKIGKFFTKNFKKSHSQKEVTKNSEKSRSPKLTKQASRVLEKEEKKKEKKEKKKEKQKKKNAKYNVRLQELYRANLIATGKDIDSMNKELEKIKEQKKEIEDALEVINENLRKYNQKLGKYNKELTEYDILLDKLKKETDKEKIKNLKQEIKKSKEENKKIIKKREKIRKKIEEKEKDKSKVEAEREEVSKTESELQGKVGEAVKNFEAIKTNIQNSTNEVIAYKRDRAQEGRNRN